MYFSRISLVMILLLISDFCFAQTGLLTQVVWRNITSDEICRKLSPLKEMSRSEIWASDNNGIKDVTNCVYKTSKAWLKLQTSNWDRQDEIVGLFIKRGQLPDENAQEKDLLLPFRYDQISSSTTLLSYCGLPEFMEYRWEKAIFYGVVVRTTTVNIFLDHNTENIYEIGIVGGRLGDFRGVPSTAKYRDQIKKFGPMFPAFTFKKLEHNEANLHEKPAKTIADIIGTTVMNGKIKIFRSYPEELSQKRKVVFCDYDCAGAITSRIQFVEYMMSNNWLNVVSIKKGKEPEKVIQVSVDVNGYIKEGLSSLALPVPLSSYYSPAASDGETWMVCPGRYQYDVCVKKNGYPTWMIYRMREDREFELKTLIFSEDNISPRYSRDSSYLLRSEYKMMPFFILPGAYENGGMKNWE